MVRNGDGEKGGRWFHGCAEKMEGLFSWFVEEIVGNRKIWVVKIWWFRLERSNREEERRHEGDEVEE